MADNPEPVKDLEQLRTRFFEKFSKDTAQEKELTDIQDALNMALQALKGAADKYAALGFQTKEEFLPGGAIQNALAGWLYEVTNLRDMKTLQKAEMVWLKSQLEGQK